MTLSANALEGREESPPWNTADGDNPPPPLMLAWTSPPPAAQLSAVLTKPSPNDAKMAAVLLCDVLGALCILLNAFVIVALIRNRRRVLVNVFYVLVLHCAIVDLIRGGCLIAWGMPHLLIHTMHSIQDRLLALKINQFTLVILRSCNLLTIFNLLVFTTNEFIVIKYPLHYRRYFRRRTVLIILAMCWMVSLLFGVGSVFSNFFESAHSVMVHSNGTTLFRRRMMAAARQRELDDREETAAEEEDGEEEEEDSGGGEGTVPTQPNGVTRRQMDGLSINVLCMLMIFVLCYVCLFTVLICYGKILRTIRRFQRCGSDGQRRVMSAIGESQKSSGASAFGRTNSIYHKRSMHQQRTQQHQQTTCQSAPAPPPMAAVRVHQQQHPAVQQAKEESALERCNSVRKKASMPGTPQSGASAAHCGRCPNCTANATADDQLGKSRRCNSHRKWRSHLMSRHKYLIVIGTVLFVDVLFLFPYSGIQMVALLHLNNLLATSHLTTLIRWGLQILIGVHSVCQPLCYFRMTEFRRLACCLGGTGPRRRFMGSGSSGAGGSIFGGGGVGASRSAKYPADSMPKAGCGGGGGADPKVDEGEEPIRKKRSIVLSTLVDEGTPPSGRILEDGRHKLVNPSVGERQMLLIAQRRRWTRNLSLLCKEEGEELEVFLGRAYRHRGDEEGGKSANARQWKGSSLRERDREGPAAADGSTERAGQERGGSDGQLLGAAQQRMVQIASRRAAVDEEQIEEEEASANGSGAALKEPQQWARMREKLLLVEEGDGGTRVPQKDKSRGGGFGALLGRLGIGRRRAHSEDDGREQCSPIGHTFLERNWKRAGGAEMVQFRMYGAQKEANDHVHLQPKLSGLSGLRSNSVFTNSTVQSRHASAQWENNNNI